MKKLDIKFYERDQVIDIARELIGKILVTKVDGVCTSGRIVEAEAYQGVIDRACHGFGGRRTARNEHMYAPGGTAYVYICYGMHHLFNVVTNKPEVPDAVLIRGIDPLEGITTMLKRTGKKVVDRTLTRGPGNLSRALGITKLNSGLKLTGNTICIMDDGKMIPEHEIGCSKRIGVESAGEAANYCYRFYHKGNLFVSASPSK
ncbi:MAG: DNA-3-methyladenine glycosylase [Chitinophagaceae bacterium]